MTQPTPDQQNELTYMVQILPVIKNLLDGIQRDSIEKNLDPELFVRAVWTWAMERLADQPTVPAWVMTDLDRMEQERAG